MPKQGYKQSKEHTQKVANAQRGKHRAFRVKRVAINCLTCNGIVIKTVAKKIKFCSKKCSNIHTAKNREVNGSGFQNGHGKLGNGSTGKHWKKTPEQLINSRLANLGEKNPNWKDGATLKNGQLRRTDQYQSWAKAIKNRDNWTCIWCGSQKELQADHIKPFAHYPEVRYDLSNGRTLCKTCHSTTDTYAGRANRLIFQSSVSQI